MDEEAALARMIGRHNSLDPRAWSPRAGDLVLTGGVVNFTYAALVIHALARADSRLTSWVEAWVRSSRVALHPAYLLAGRPDCDGAPRAAFIDRAWAFDVHLATINLLVVAVLFALSRAAWPAGARRLDAASPLGDAADGAHAADMEEGFGTVLWGALAALWWMLLQNDLFDTARHCAGLRPWLLFREPLLATCVHGLACLAAALNRARTV